MKKTMYIAGSAFVVIIIVVYILFARSHNQSYNFKFDKISQGDITVYVTATGTINAVTSVDVGTQVSGIVAKLYADFNSVVKQGQVIAQIDSTFLIQSVKDAEANLDRAKAQYTDSKRNLERVKTLLDRGLESQLNYDASLTTYESNSAALKSAQAALDRARINLAYATIYAPIDGVVINRAVNIGQTVAASFSSPTLFTIANDLKKMQVQTTVDETDIGRVSIGQEATFTVDAYPDDKFSGTVSQIRLAPQSIQNVVNYIVLIDVQNDQLKLMPGMTANVKILVASAANVLKISNMALRFQPAPDLIDTTGTGSMRSKFMGKGEDITDSSKSEQASSNNSITNNSFTHQRIAGDQGMPYGNIQVSQGDRIHFQFLRDSIQAAHGGKLSRDEMRQEIQKMFKGRMNRAVLPARQNPTIGKATKTKNKFGIISNFPEYQKSAYIPSHQSGKGRVWILKPNGLLESVFVRTGLNDGRFTEISSMKLKLGDQIVLGATSLNDSSPAQVQNPLSGSGQQQRGGGFR
jgi:HlyD family secretion protein